MILLKRLRAQNFKLLRDLDLIFPRQGSVLIEGLNESGKSTLFESVFFALYGIPLITEGRGRGNLESIIRYGADSASVELLLEIDDVEMLVRRVVRRGKTTQASLIVWRPGAPEEQVAGVQAVNAQVVEELKGLDGEALLNSCFVEQKKLSKLEDLGSGARKDSVRKLLNLDRMTELAEKFRVTLQDERALGEARERLELAEVADQLPALSGQRAALEHAARGGVETGGRGDGETGRRGDAETRGHGDAEKDASPPLPLGEGRGEGAVDAPPAPPHPPFGRPLPGGEARTGQGAGLGPAPILSAGGEEAWGEVAARLGANRASAAATRRRALLLAVGAGLALLLAGGLALAGLTMALWILLPSALLAVASAVTFRSLGRVEAEAADLQSKLSSWRDLLVARGGELEGRKRRAEERLGLEAETLDLEECRQELTRLSRQLEVKRRAAALVEGTMERIARMVLPNTERNLAQMLPLLTAGRYHEARIGEDYQIQVWDDAAGRYVSKSIFSGGARDQFSLALRLAFAMATLPQELGAAPGFLFLDEPLSAFDVPRTEALVQLITVGQVAASFSQIFVVSHNRSFAPDAFQYRLTMRDGRVVESSLPEEPW